MTGRKHYRVAVWGTGNVGMHSVRKVIEHPQFELVGVRVYSDAKLGRDAGELCGTHAAGVITTNSIEDIIAARPDCVVYLPDRSEIDVLCRLLESGINIATARFEFNRRDSIAPDIRESLEAACARGKASLYCSGSTPGWFTEVMPLVLSALERRLDCLTLTDYADMSSRNSPEMLFDLLKFGADPSSVDPNAPFGTAMSSPPTLSMAAEAMGLPVEEIVTSRQFAVARKREAIAAGTIEPGTIAALRMEIEGRRNGKPVIRRRSIWYVTRDIEPAWELRETGLHYRVEGDLPLDVMFTIPVSPEVYPSVSPGLTAHPVLNAIPYICEAPPGILQTPELPLVVGMLGE
jgi:4-hydroxy-tetrahydrodipicolinate reductase